MQKFFELWLNSDAANILLSGLLVIFKAKLNERVDEMKKQDKSLQIEKNCERKHSEGTEFIPENLTGNRKRYNKEGGKN